MKNNFKFNLTILICLLIILYSKPAWADTNILKDLKKDSWYYEDVINLLNEGYIKGYPDNTFRPNKDISLAEFLKLSMSALKSTDYPQGKNYWWEEVYYDATIDAIIDMENFPMKESVLNKSLSREDMAYIIVGLNENIQNEPSLKAKSFDIKDIKDANDINKEAIYQAYGKGLLQGKGEFFKPKDITTRAEAAIVIKRLLERKKD